MRLANRVQNKILHFFQIISGDNLNEISKSYFPWKEKKNSSNFHMMILPIEGKIRPFIQIVAGDNLNLMLSLIFIWCFITNT